MRVNLMQAVLILIAILLFTGGVLWIPSIYTPLIRVLMFGLLYGGGAALIYTSGYLTAREHCRVDLLHMATDFLVQRAMDIRFKPSQPSISPGTIGSAAIREAVRRAIPATILTTPTECEKHSHN